MIKRQLHERVLDRLELFPAVALLGPRQVGKTTLAENIAADRRSVYLDLESPSDSDVVNLFITPQLSRFFHFC